jgi:hypothetical protein
MRAHQNQPGKEKIPGEQDILFLKVCPGWGAKPGSFNLVYFLIPSLYR